MNLGFDAYVDVIGEELDRIVDLAVESPALLIPAQPGRRMGQLVDELTDQLTEWWASIGLDSDAGPTTEAEGESELIQRGDALLAALRTADLRAAADGIDDDDDDDDDDEEDSVPSPFVIARTAAVTCAVYRSDIERALGRPGRIETELAVDGIDERLDRSCAEPSTWEGTMCLIALDSPDAWMVEGRRGWCTWRKGRGPAVAAVVGHASDLFLYVWGRLSPDDLTVTGEFRIAQSWTGARS